MNKRIECEVRGMVQMVMFRDFTKRNARKLGLTGFVKNNTDGSVSVIAEGEDGVLGRFMEILNKGPMLARVDDISIEWKDATGEFTSFDIKY